MKKNMKSLSKKITVTRKKKRKQSMNDEKFQFLHQLYFVQIFSLHQLWTKIWTIPSSLLLEDDALFHGVSENILQSKTINFFSVYKKKNYPVRFFGKNDQNDNDSPVLNFFNATVLISLTRPFSTLVKQLLGLIVSCICC